VSGTNIVITKSVIRQKGEIMILAIDPGNIESAYVLMDGYAAVEFGKVTNAEMREIISRKACANLLVVIERIASYGMAVGKEVFETCEWVGRFTELAGGAVYVYRKDVKINLCGTNKAKDSNIRQALIDRFGVVGTKNKQGYFYGFKADVWSAYAVGVTYLDNTRSR